MISFSDIIVQRNNVLDFSIYSVWLKEEFKSLNLLIFEHSSQDTQGSLGAILPC